MYINLTLTQKSCSISIMQRTALVCTILLRLVKREKLIYFSCLHFDLFINTSGTFQLCWEPWGIEEVPFSEFSFPEVPALRVRSIYAAL